MVNDPDSFVFSLKTAYRYVNAGLLSTKRGDLPRACALKPRKGKASSTGWTRHAASVGPGKTT